MEEKLITTESTENIKPDNNVEAGVTSEVTAAQRLIEPFSQPEDMFSTEKSNLGKLAITCFRPEESHNPTYSTLSSDLTPPRETMKPKKNISKLRLGKLLNIRRRYLAGGLVAIVMLLFAGALVFNQPKITDTLDSALTIGGVAVSEQQPDIAMQQLNEAAAQQKIRLQINNEVLVTTAAEIGISRNVDSALKDAQNVKRNIAEKLGVKNKKQINIPMTTQVNKDKLNNFIGSKLGGQLLAKDAQLTLVGEEFVVAPGQKGLSIDINELVGQMNQTNLSDQPTITAKTVLIEPNITNEIAERAKNQAYEAISPVYNVGHPGIGFKLIGMNLKTKWVVISPDSSKKSIEISLNKDQAQQDLEYLAKSFNRGTKDRIKVNIPGQATVVLDDGYDGLVMSQDDINKAKIELAANIDAKKPYDATINPVFQPRAERVYDGQQKMVLVDINNFRAYAVENNQTIRSVPITSGKPGFGTPSGTFVVGRKTTVSTMSACSRGECWSVPNIKWQSYFTGDGHAIHATTANSAVGVKNISHGCIGMYESDAKWFFDWAVAGTPVVIVR